MDTSSFYTLIFSNIGLYSICLLLSIIVYYFVFRKYFLSILDPFFLGICFSLLGFATVLFLFFNNNINIYWFFSYLLTQFAFFIGFRMCRPLTIAKYSEKIEVSNQQIRLSKWIFLISGVFTILSTLLIYYFKGIPIFAASRLNMVGDDSLFKIIMRISTITFPVYMFMTIYFLTIKEKKSIPLQLFSYLSLIVLLVFSILSGSKSSILALGFGLFIYSIYSTRWGDYFVFSLINKFSKKFLIFAVIIALISISLAEDSNPFFYLLYRIVSSSDAYFMSYPNDVIEIIPKENWFIALFASPLKMVGLIDATRIPEPIGFRLMEYHHHVQLFKGPNSRHNIFGFVYFGFGWSIVYSFVLGYVLSFVRNKMFYRLSKNILGSIFYFLLLSSAIFLEADFHLSLAFFINILFLYFPLLIVSILIDNYYIKGIKR